MSIDLDKIIVAMQQAKNNDRDQLWHYRKRENLFIADLYQQAGRLDYYRGMTKCGTYLKFAYGNFDEETQQIPIRLVAINACGIRHCPNCQYLRSRKWQAKTFQVLPKIYNLYPYYRWIFLTLTVKTCEITDLRKVFKAMNEGFRRLTQRKDFPAFGWIKSFEVSRCYDLYYNSKYIMRTGLTGIKKWTEDMKKKDSKFNQELISTIPTTECHPHFHILILVPPSYFGRGYISQDQYTSDWQACMKLGYKPIVHVTAVKDILKSVPEIVKYQTKSQDLKGDPEYLLELTNQMHGLRAVNTGGAIAPLLKEIGDERIELGYSNDEMIFSGVISTWCWGDDNTTRYADNYDINGCQADFVDVVNYLI
jgi:hypothetical protein